jgi:hypothetical protein
MIRELSGSSNPVRAVKAMECSVQPISHERRAGGHQNPKFLERATQWLQRLGRTETSGTRSVSIV